MLFCENVLSIVNVITRHIPVENSESNAFSQLDDAPSDMQPLELELLALLCLPTLISLGVE